MPVIRTGSRREVIVDREAILRPELSPKARLLYVVLLALPDDQAIDQERTAAMAGISVDEIEGLVQTLANTGLADYVRHRSEGKRSLTVHSYKTEALHECIPCEGCGACSCYGLQGLCDRCRHRQRVQAAANRDIARYQERLAAGATYAMTSGGTRLHRWDCPTLLPSVADRLAELERTRGGYWHSLPHLFTAEQLRARRYQRKRCATGGPTPT